MPLGDLGDQALQVQSATLSGGLVSVTMSRIGNQKCLVCDARELHGFLGVKRDFSTWFKDRIAEYEFVAGEDYIQIGSPNLGNQKGRGGDRRSRNFVLTLDMAKDLAMVERNDQGRRVRKYFIECERLVHEGCVGGSQHLSQPEPALWLYEGSPENLDLKIPRMPSVEGGYVFVLELSTGGVMLCASNEAGTNAHNIGRRLEEFDVALPRWPSRAHTRNISCSRHG